MSISLSVTVFLSVFDCLRGETESRVRWRTIRSKADKWVENIAKGKEAQGRKKRRKRRKRRRRRKRKKIGKDGGKVDGRLVVGVVGEKKGWKGGTWDGIRW